jgi:hypothetical protein
VTALSAALGPRDGLALPGAQGAAQGQPGHPGERADDRLPRAVPLGPRVWHRLAVLAGIGQPPGALAPIPAPPTDVGRRPAGPRPQATGGAARPPMTSMPSTLRPSVAPGHLRRLDQEDRAAARRQHLDEGAPRDSGRGQRARRDATGGSPVGQRLQGSRAGPKAASRWGGVRRWTRDIRGVCPDVAACGVSVDGRQVWWARGWGRRRCRLALGHGRLPHRLGSHRAASAGAAGLQHSSPRAQVSAGHP